MNTSPRGQRLPIVALAVAMMSIAACTSAAATPVPTVRITPGPAVESTPTTPTAPPSAIVAEFDAGGAGWAMTKAGDALWIQVDPPVDAIVRIDVASGSTTPAVPAGWKAKFGPEGLWVVCCDWLARIDPATGEETLRIPMGGAYALADGAVWLANDDGLHRIDATTGIVGEPVGPGISSVCGSSKDMVIAFESAWLACKEGKVVRIDLASGDASEIPTPAGTHTFTVADGAVWVTNYRAGSVSRIDPQTNEVTTIAGAGSGVGITTGDGYVWAATSNGIAKIDPATNSIVREIDLGPGQYYELVWDEGIIWVSTRGSHVLKVDPSKATR
jgi:streptogramin lyase